MPASADAAATAVADVREERERVSKYLTRLKEVRHKRSAMEVHTADILPLDSISVNSDNEQRLW